MYYYRGHEVHLKITSEEPSHWGLLKLEFDKKGSKYEKIKNLGVQNIEVLMFDPGYLNEILFGIIDCLSFSSFFFCLKYPMYTMRFVIVAFG